MKKKIFRAVVLALALISCKGPLAPPNPEPSPEPLPEPIVESDLSADGTANCYIVDSFGLWHFDATVMGNGAAAGGFHPEKLAPVSAKLVWQSVPGMIKNCVLDAGTGHVRFRLEKTGNALLAALDGDGKIIWSWHIWAPGKKVEQQCGIMNMNLGAMDSKAGSVSSCGLLYQWGRKDPLPGSPQMSGGTTSTKQIPVYDADGAEVVISNSSWADDSNNTVAFSIANPTVCISSMKHYSASRDWLKPGENNASLWAREKTCFDPCPAGWQLPDGEEFAGFTSTGAFVYDQDDINAEKPYNAGWNFILPDGSTSYFPAATRYDGSYGMFMGSMAGLWGNYWYCIADEDSELVAHGSHALSFSIKDMYGKDSLTASPVSTGGRADAYSVRCVLSRQ